MELLVIDAGAKILVFGGGRLDEVDPTTMMSRIVQGLFFAGEVLDVDGELGGYNFQWAWSGGAACNRAAARKGL